jgi:hypothetical protein
LTETKNQTFSPSEQVETDGRTFTDCTFNEASLVYSGGEHPKFERCTFHSCGWHFSGAALKTIQFLQQINASPGGQDFLADIFRPGAYLTD